MDILNTFTLKSNRQIKINFDRGDLSSDAGLLLIKEFAAKIGLIRLIKKKFKTNDKSVRFHKDDENLMQMIYQIISAYFQDNCADELTWNPVFNAILEKKNLASQPTLSKFKRVSGDTPVDITKLPDDDKGLYYKDEPYTTKKLHQRLIITYSPNPDKPEKLFLFSTPCVILKKKGVFICYSLINTLIKFMASLPVMTA